MTWRNAIRGLAITMALVALIMVVTSVYGITGGNDPKTIQGTAGTIGFMAFLLWWWS